MNQIEELRKAKTVYDNGLTPTQYYSQLVKEFAPAWEISGVPCSAMYKIFCEWCIEKGHDLPNSKLLGYALKDAYNMTSSNKRIGGKPHKIYCGNVTNK